MVRSWMCALGCALANVGEGALVGGAIGSDVGLPAILATGAGANIAENIITNAAVGDLSNCDTAGGAAAEIVKDGVLGAGEATFGKVIAGPAGKKWPKQLQKQLDIPTQKPSQQLEDLQKMWKQQLVLQ